MHSVPTDTYCIYRRHMYRSATSCQHTTQTEEAKVGTRRAKPKLQLIPSHPIQSNLSYLISYPILSYPTNILPFLQSNILRAIQPDHGWQLSTWSLVWPIVDIQSLLSHANHPIHQGTNTMAQEQTHGLCRNSSDEHAVRIEC